jgi:hypothetical protein
MRANLIPAIVLAAAFMLVNAEVNAVAKKTPVNAANSRAGSAKSAQLLPPVTQPENINPPLSLSATPLDLPDVETAKPTDITVSPRSGEQINWQVFASGGGTQTVGTLILSSTIGQTAAGPSSVGSYFLQSGFWQNFGSGYLCGDADHSGGIDIADVVYLVAYIFSAGPAPDPLFAGDADCDGEITIADVVYLVNYIFSGGAAPCAACK